MNNNNRRIESFLSARLFLVPQVVDNWIYFISNLSGRNSLYRMVVGGGVPEPLLPPHIALQNPHLLGGRSFIVFPDIEKILVMIDEDGDELYQPMIIPLNGGYPEPAFPGAPFGGSSVFAADEDLARNFVYLMEQPRAEPLFRSFKGDVATGELTQLRESRFGGFPIAHNERHDCFVLLESYGAGDNILYLLMPETETPEPLYGRPLAERSPEEEVPPTGIGSGDLVEDDQALLFKSILFDDAYSLGYMPLDDPHQVQSVEVEGLVHTGMGELETFHHLEHPDGDRYLLEYNIDGVSWVYESVWDEAQRIVHVRHHLVGGPAFEGRLADGVLESITYDPEGDRFALSFSTATSPTQIYTIEGAEREQLVQHTAERILGLPQELLSAGEEYPFTSHDGLRISARLYLPSEALGYEGPRPLVYYIHGGPQSQERPDFAWFSMPLIQFLTLNGFAVFVPNVRGSTGYGFSYMHHVIRDWGGQDRLDHVHTMTAVLPQDERLDTSRAGVVGRSYGGYMTLTLAARHPELWSAAVDMFGPYNLLTFAERVPETWKIFVSRTVGDPVEDREFMIERSPRSYLDALRAPLLVIQGKNDPRVREEESRELVEELNEQGKEVDYLMLADEGHDILKFENRVRVYNAIVDFFKEHLQVEKTGA
ncbi:MAG: prolyl oligopeptidase family serine peptidase [Candidatus Promineifilaceae bacterium]|nr:prolyl oligopeptidase family serine peptidase [Candidatus Promineifilaceae bacterium]